LLENYKNRLHLELREYPVKKLNYAAASIILLAFLVTTAAAQQDTIYLKNGGLIVGTIIEDNPGSNTSTSSLKIRVASTGYWIVYYSYIEKISGSSKTGRLAGENLLKLPGPRYRIIEMPGKRETDTLL
jgi:hypothetical protein